MIVRGPKAGDFSVLPNAGANDRNLHGLARAVLWHLLSKPDGWQVNTKYLMAEFDCGRDAMRRALNELEVAAYLRRVRYSQHGTWHHVSVVFEVPRHRAQCAAGAEAGPQPLSTLSPLFGEAEVILWAEERMDFLHYKRSMQPVRPRRAISLKGR